MVTFMILLQASSVMYSLIETAKENGLHPRRYLEYLLKTLSSATTDGLDNLLPWSTALPEDCYMRKGEVLIHGKK